MENKKRINVIIAGILCGLILSILFFEPNQAEAAMPSISNKTLTISVGQKKTIKVNNVKKGQKVTYKTSNKNIATVSNGTIKGIKSGKANITATVAGKKLVCKVTVTKPALSASSFYMHTGTGYLHPITLKGYTGGEIAWSVSGNAKASVTKTSKKNVIMPSVHLPGRAVFTAKYLGKTYKCTVYTYAISSLDRVVPIGIPDKIYLVGASNISPYFVSNDKKIATVDALTGVIKGVKPGRVRINVYDKKEFAKKKYSANVIDYCLITVIEKGKKIPMSAKEKTIYSKITALKGKYYDGMSWTNKTGYTWAPPRTDGVTITVSGGCYAFAEMVSDLVFGKKTPVKIINNKDGKIMDKIKVGDIVVMENGGHAGILLGKETGSYIIAEGNYCGRIKWGRRLANIGLNKIIKAYTRY